MSVVAFPRERHIETARVVALDFIAAGRFEAYGPHPSGYGARWRFGKLGRDPIPRWAERVHLSRADFDALFAMVKADEEKADA